MRSKAEVLGSLRELVRVLLVERELRRELADAAVDTLADDLCDNPEPKKVVGVPVEDVAYVPTEAADEVARLKSAMSRAWQEGYDCRDQRKPGGTRNNPYHLNYQGFSSARSPESWTEERSALLAENEVLRAKNKAHRADLALSLSRPADTGWKTLLEEVAILLETNRANERNARETKQVLQAFGAVMVSKDGAQDPHFRRTSDL